MKSTKRNRKCIILKIPCVCKGNNWLGRESGRRVENILRKRQEKQHMKQHNKIYQLN
jgi:hypothetical protein